ncbi:MAG: flagellar motor protein MotB [Pseudomonadota bacterium]
MIEIEEEEKRGVADWMTTYADLMSLLMCFFVLLLSFSEMDIAKYKQLAGSMKQAFGVQNEIRLKDIPKGTSIIAQEFSPGRPNPTPMNTIQQQSTNTRESSLDIRTNAPGEHQTQMQVVLPSEAVQRLMEQARKLDTQRAAEALREKLRLQIERGNIEIEYDLDSITVRIRERGSFPSGSATLTDEFLPIIPIIQEALRDIEGEIAVEGHTDNVPINNERFRSNWELSSQRALSLAHELLKDPELASERFMIVGYADARPRVDNDSWSNRAQNRRVEIVIRRTPTNQPAGSIVSLRPADET